MLILSELLLRSGDQIRSFAELKTAVKQAALATGTLHFQLDIEPPAYPDRPENWYDQLEIAFMDAGR